MKKILVVILLSLSAFVIWSNKYKIIYKLVIFDCKVSSLISSGESYDKAPNIILKYGEQILPYIVDDIKNNNNLSNLGVAMTFFRDIVKRGNIRIDAEILEIVKEKVEKKKYLWLISIEILMVADRKYATEVICQILKCPDNLDSTEDIGKSLHCITMLSYLLLIDERVPEIEKCIFKLLECKDSMTRLKASLYIGKYSPTKINPLFSSEENGRKE